MAIGTSNPVGSTDPRDLLANAENLDNLVNGASDEYPDRFSVMRKSWAYIEAQVSNAGSGYHGFIPQSSDPATPSSGFRLFATAAGLLAWKDANGFKRVFDGTENTADRTYTLPDSSGVVVLDSTLASTVHVATLKTTLVDSDEIAGTDSENGYSLIRTTMSNVWTYIKSKADSVYAAIATQTVTFATLQTYNATTYAGRSFIVSDLNYSRWQAVNGVWRPVNGLFFWDALLDPVALIPSGTISSGTSGQCSLGSNALDRAYPTGAWGIFPAVATTPALPAGTPVWFTCTASNTLTLYQSKGGAAINFSGSPVAFTGVTTYQPLYSSPSVPGSMWGNSGGFECKYNMAVTNSANAKTASWTLGSATGLAGNNLTSITGGSGYTFRIENTQAQARQSYTANPYALNQGTAVSVVDMTTAQNFSFGVTRANANDAVVLHSMKVMCFVNN